MEDIVLPHELDFLFHRDGCGVAHHLHMHTFLPSHLVVEGLGLHADFLLHSFLREHIEAVVRDGLHHLHDCAFPLQYLATIVRKTHHQRVCIVDLPSAHKYLHNHQNSFIRHNHHPFIIIAVVCRRIGVGMVNKPLIKQLPCMVGVNNLYQDIVEFSLGMLEGGEGLMDGDPLYLVGRVAVLEEQIVAAAHFHVYGSEFFHGFIHYLLQVLIPMPKQ